MIYYDLVRLFDGPSSSSVSSDSSPDGSLERLRGLGTVWVVSSFPFDPFPRAFPFAGSAVFLLRVFFPVPPDVFGLAVTAASSSP